jgi:hypothetical protein
MIFGYALRVVLVTVALVMAGCSNEVVDFDINLQVERLPEQTGGVGKVYKSTKKIGTTFQFSAIAYEDEKLKINFYVKDLYITAEVKNKLDKQMILLWDQAKLANSEEQYVQLTTFEFIKNGNKVVSNTFEILDAKPIEPMNTIVTRFKPDYRKLYDSGKIFNLDKDSNSAASVKDSKLILTLPVKIGLEVIQYKFILTVEGFKTRSSYY